MCHFQSQDDPFVLNILFLVQTIITFIYLLALFIVQNLQQILMANPMLWDSPFLGLKWSICPKQFFGENYWYHFHLTISPFHCAEFEKNPFSGSRVMRICNFWAYNGPIAQMRILLENMLMDPVSFIHAYLHAKNQTQTLIY